MDKIIIIIIVTAEYEGDASKRIFHFYELLFYLKGKADTAW